MLAATERKSQRQADQLEKRADSRPEQTPQKSNPRQDINQAALRITEQNTE